MPILHPKMDVIHHVKCPGEHLPGAVEYVPIEEKLQFRAFGRYFKAFILSGGRAFVAHVPTGDMLTAPTLVDAVEDWKLRLLEDGALV